MKLSLDERQTKQHALQSLGELLGAPATVIDVGVQHGTPVLYEAFPEAAHLLIEPVAEHQESLEGIKASLTTCHYAIAAATDFDGEVGLSVTPNFLYAATTKQAKVPGRSVRQVRAVRVDTMLAELQWAGPYLLKVDVDGHEVSVLKGSSETLQNTVMAIVESTPFIQFHNVIDTMRASNFVVYDVVEPVYRPTDHALWQVDLVFVPEDSPLRADRAYATPKQLAELAGKTEQ